MSGSPRVAIVTGGSQGIGYAAVTALAARGLTVVAVARGAAALEASVAALDPASRERVVAIPTDVTSEEQVNALVAEVIDRFGRLDVLLNCAGTSMNARRRLVDTTTPEWEQLLQVNLTGTYLMCRAALPHLETSGDGYIINVLSTAAHTAKAGVSLYAATKFGARALTEALVEEYRGTAVRVSSISPGPIDTPIWNRKLEPPTEETRSKMLRPNQVGELLAWMLELPVGLHVADVTVTPWR